MELHLVFDNIQKPTNVGSIIRLALGLNATLTFTGNSIKHTHPKCKAAAVGYIENATVSYSDNLDQCLELLRAKGVAVYGTSPYAKTLHWDIDYTQKVAIVFGNECSGLSKQKRQKIGPEVLIPIPGSIESLNLAASAAIIGYEALRQNHKNRPVLPSDIQGKPDHSF